MKIGMQKYVSANGCYYAGICKVIYQIRLFLMNKFFKYFGGKLICGMYHCSLMAEEGKKESTEIYIWWLYFFKKPFSCFPFYGLLYLYIVLEKQYSVLYYVVAVVVYVLPLLLGSPYCVHLAVITMFYWPSSNNEASSIE